MATSDTGKEQKSGYDGNLQIEYANNRIIVKDGTNNRLILGETPEGDIKMKLSQPTFDVLIASNDQLIWSSDFNNFKIVSVVTGTHTVSAGEAAANYANFSFAHNLGYMPTIIASVANDIDGLSRPLPYAWRANASHYGGIAACATIDIKSIDNTNINCRFDVFDIHGASWIISGGVLSFKFYCLRETII